MPTSRVAKPGLLLGKYVSSYSGGTAVGQVQAVECNEIEFPLGVDAELEMALGQADEKTREDFFRTLEIVRELAKAKRALPSPKLAPPVATDANAAFYAKDFASLGSNLTD